MLRHGTLSSLVGLATAILSLTAHADITVEHSQGQTALDATPDTVLTYDIATLDSLDALNVDVTGLPQGFVPPRLSEYRGDDYTNIGSLFEPDFETVAALQPDLVVVANRSSKAYGDLSKLAPTVDLTVWGDDYLDQFRDTSRTLGTIFNKTDEVESRLATIDEKVERAQTLAADAGEALIILTNGGKLSAYGPGSRFGWIHDELGLASAVQDLEKGTHGDPISFEYLLETDPDYLFVIDRDGAIDPDQAAARATLDNDLVKQTQAYQNDRIVYLDSVNWYIVMSGLTAVDQMVTEVVTALEN